MACLHGCGRRWCPKAECLEPSVSSTSHPAEQCPHGAMRGDGCALPRSIRGWNWSAPSMFHGMGPWSRMLVCAVALAVVGPLAATMDGQERRDLVDRPDASRKPDATQK